MKNKSLTNQVKSFRKSLPLSVSMGAGWIILVPNYPDEEVMKELREKVGKILNEDEYKVHYEFVEQLSLTYRGKLNFLDQKTPLDFECIANLGN